ncbi:DUF892 family protein [Leptospira interrogans]
MPDMISKASSRQLRRGFEHHLNETQEHVHRLDHALGHCSGD